MTDTGQPWPKPGGYSLVRQEYLFGHHNLAARRLAKLHEVFAASSGAFVRRAAPQAPAAAVDLGCGVGHTTEMLRRALRPGLILGLDSGAPFLERALSKYRHCCFAMADAALPLPVRGAQVIYARYLLAHLAHPLEAAARWTESLHPGGLLLLEENAGYDTLFPPFACYMQTVGALMAGQGLDLLVGERLPGMTPPPGCVLSAQVTPVTAPGPVAAELFAMNLPSWGEKAVAAGRIDTGGLEALAAALAAARQDEATPAFTWFLAQAVVRRGGDGANPAAAPG